MARQSPHSQDWHHKDHTKTDPWIPALLASTCHTRPDCKANHQITCPKEPPPPLPPPPSCHRPIPSLLHPPVALSLLRSLDRTRNGWVTRRRRRVVADLVGGLGLHGFHVLEGHGPGRESGAGDRRGTAVWVPEKAEKPSELISLGQQENKRRHVCNGQLCHWPLSKISVFATTRGVPI